MVCGKCKVNIAEGSVTCFKCGFTNALPDESGKKPKWFDWFLYGMILLDVILIISSILVLAKPEPGDETGIANIIILRMILYAVEIVFYILFHFHMKRKLLIAYMGFLIVGGIVGVLTSQLGVFRYVLVYLVFQSQWDKFKKS